MLYAVRQLCIHLLNAPEKMCETKKTLVSAATCPKTTGERQRQAPFPQQQKQLAAARQLTGETGFPTSRRFPEAATSARCRSEFF